jgi:GTP-binding protein
MRAADVIMLVVDATVGVIEEDAQVANVLRKLGTPVVVVANKIDDANRESSMWEFQKFGLGDPSGISALHGRGTGDMLDRVVALLPDDRVVDAEAEDGDEDEEAQGPRVFAVAIVGRPNVGKSTLFNRMIGDERAVVHDMPGTTRDAIDTVVETEEGPIRFVDTAGMRRRSRIGEGTEYYSLVRALQAVDRSDVALLVIDATEGITAQDQRLAERIDAAGCPIVILLNKWETLDADEREVVTREVGRKLHFTANSVVLKVSALTGKGVHRLLPALGEAIEAYHTRIPTKKVNDAIRAAQSAQPAPHGARVLYATQGAADPPTFTLFANRELPPTYLRYLERKLREAFALGPTPIKLRVRRRSE